MKKIKAGLLVLMVLLLLTACGPKEEAQPYIKAGDAALAKEEYVEAITAYAEALNIQEHEDILLKLDDARTKHLEQRKAEYQKLMSELEYEKAKPIAESILGAYKDKLENDEKKIYEKDIKNLTNLIKQQAIFDDYLTWAKPYVLELSQIGSDWTLTSRTLELGGATKAKIEQDLRDLILRNQEVTGAIESKTYNVNTALSETHGILYEIVLKNDSAFSGALGSLRKDEELEKIINAGEPATEAKKLLNTTFTSAIRSYATEYELKDTFQDIIYNEEETEKSEETEENK